MARYDSLTRVIADLSYIPQRLNSGAVHADWRMERNGNVLSLDVTCTEGHIPEDFTKVMAWAAEQCKQAGVSMRLNFVRTQFGVPADDRLDAIRKLIETHEARSRSMEQLRQLPEPPAIEARWTEAPSYTPSYTYTDNHSAHRGFDWEWLQDCVVYFLIVVGTLAFSWFMWVTHGLTQF